MIIAWTMGRLFFSLNPLHLNKPWNMREKFTEHGTVFRKCRTVIYKVFGMLLPLLFGN